MSSKLLAHPAALCNMVRRIAVEAGHETLQYFEEAGFSGSAEEKADGSPVTEADRAAEALIERGLADLIPGIPVIGEEAVAQGRIPDLSSSEYFWLVDPIDGTKEFISGGGDYTVNIALIHRDAPLLGVVYAPVIGELYAGCGEGTALRWNEDTDAEKDIRARRMPREGLTVIASRSHGDNARLDAYLQNYKIRTLKRRGSSLKMCMIASGKADLYPRLGPTSEWDTAASDAVLRAAGGSIRDLKGKPLVYGKHAEKFLNPEFVAASGDFFTADSTS